MKNIEICGIFREIANILEIKGDNPFRVRAYERAAENIESLTGNIEDYVQEGRLSEISGIGHDLAEKITEFVKTGKIKSYNELKKTIPKGLLDLLDIPQIGPKTVKLLYEKLKIKNLADLQKAIEEKKLQGIPGIKEKTIENIKRGIEIVKKGRQRMPLGFAIAAADEFTRLLKQIPAAENVSVAGSLRRQKETVRDIDILVVSNQPQEIMDTFVKASSVKEILAEGITKSSVRTTDGLQVDCRVVEQKSYGAALIYFTGSKNFNIKLRAMAQKKGFKINEYGVFKQDRFIAGKTEQEIFKLLGLSFIEPELREDNGEIELAADNKLPRLIELKDIKGDLHTHSKWSDGRNTIEEMASAAKKKGYSYIAVTDHSQSLKVAKGLSIADLKKKKAEIDKINRKMKDFRILFGTEVDIDSQGNLDYKDEVLKEFDIVVAAIHTGFKQPKAQITKRLIKACKNKYTNIIAHPTGCLWGVREPYEVDFNEVFKAASDTNTCMEINSFSDRLDLNSVHSRFAKEMGVRISIDTDSHATAQLDMIKLGVAVARRGWLSKGDVVNTLGLKELFKVIKK
ncbi:MAG: DNA polymerase/3'-5' exonuclease PolX [Candidatus Omnitrophota bacterium]